MTRCVIHIGLHKTGSTFLQAWMAQSRAWLREQGVAYPQNAIVRPSHPAHATSTRGHQGLIGAARAWANGRPPELLDQLREEVAGAPTVVFSSEVFAAPRMLADVPAIVDWVRTFAEPTVLAYVRRQDHWIDSFYREYLCWTTVRETRTIDAFIADGSPWLDLEARIGVWAQAVGAGNTIVRSYDDVRRGPGLLADLMTTLGVDAPPPPRDLGDANPSLSPELVDLMRAINGGPPLEPERKAKLVQAFRAGEGKSARASLVSDTTWAALAARFREANRQFAERSIDGPAEAFMFPQTREPVARAHQTLPVEAASVLVQQLADLGAQSPSGAVLTGPGSFGVVTTLKQPLQHTRHFINYHLNLGASHLWLYFDDPEDPAISAYEGHPRVTTFACTPAHWMEVIGHPATRFAQKQRANLKHAHPAIAARGIAWAISVDSDELLLADEPISRILARTAPEVELIKVHVAEAVLHDNLAPGVFRSRYFKRRPKRGTPAHAAMKTAYADIAHYTRHGFFGHVEGKSFWRTSAPIDEHRQHRPRNATRDLVRIDSQQIRLLHFDCMTFALWKEKWARRISGETKALDISEERQRQHERIAEALATSDAAAEALFNAWFRPSRAKLRELIKANLVIEADIDDALFTARPKD